mgnify:CR=1 FL=1
MVSLGLFLLIRVSLGSHHESLSHFLADLQKQFIGSLILWALFALGKCGIYFVEWRVCVDKELDSGHFGPFDLNDESIIILRLVKISDLTVNALYYFELLF